MFTQSVVNNMCIGGTTRVLLVDGSTKYARDVKAGDILAGPIHITSCSIIWSDVFSINDIFTATRNHILVAVDQYDNPIYPSVSEAIHMSNIKAIRITSDGIRQLYNIVIKQLDNIGDFYLFEGRDGDGECFRLADGTLVSKN